MTRIGILGLGSWGTGLALSLARGGREVVLWGWEADTPDEVQRTRENARYLPGFMMPKSILVTSDLSALADCEVVLGVVPSSATRSVLVDARPHLAPGTPWVSATKGLEPGTCARMTEVARDVLGDGHPVAALSGPSFAREVAEGLPTAVVVACSDMKCAQRVQELVSSPSFRVYTSPDVIGVELGGALKNVIAIAAGLISGMGLGHDALAALVTRGLREITLLSVALGAQRDTMTGLAGLGDLVLTCTGAASRNRRLGEAIASGQPVAEALAALGQVSEGVATTERALEQAEALGIDMPITAAVRDVLLHGHHPRAAVDALMRRSLKEEASW